MSEEHDSEPFKLVILGDGRVIRIPQDDLVDDNQEDEVSKKEPFLCRLNIHIPWRTKWDTIGLGGVKTCRRCGKSRYVMSSF